MGINFYYLMGVKRINTVEMVFILERKPIFFLSVENKISPRDSGIHVDVRFEGKTAETKFSYVYPNIIGKGNIKLVAECKKSRIITTTTKYNTGADGLKAVI